MKKKGSEAEKKMKKIFEHAVPLHVCAMFLLLAVWSGVALDCMAVFAEEMSALKGRVTDVEGRPVEGVRVYVYGSSDVKGPANYMSSPTGNKGLFRMVLSAGRYWAVARLKKEEGFGPLMPGDKHSGEPLEVELAPGAEMSADFAVSDLREAIKIKTKTREGAFRISGRIVDESGGPLKKAYVFANRNEKVSGIPDYLSAWVDDEGRYILYISPGKYYIGGDTTFPPGNDYFMGGEITVDGDKSGVDIVRRSGK